MKRNKHTTNPDRQMQHKPLRADVQKNINRYHAQAATARAQQPRRAAPRNADWRDLFAALRAMPAGGAA